MARQTAYALLYLIAVIGLLPIFFWISGVWGADGSPATERIQGVIAAHQLHLVYALLFVFGAGLCLFLRERIQLFLILPTLLWAVSPLTLPPGPDASKSDVQALSERVVYLEAEQEDTSQKIDKVRQMNVLYQSQDWITLAGRKSSRRVDLNIGQKDGYCFLTAVRGLVDANGGVELYIQDGSWSLFMADKGLIKTVGAKVMCLPYPL